MNELSHETLDTQADEANDADRADGKQPADAPAPDADAMGTRGEPADATRSLLDEVLSASSEEGSWLDRFLAEPDPWRAIKHWLEHRSGPAPRRLDRATLGALLDTDIAQIDRLLTDQANAILHHKTFQKLESSWRGLAYTVGQASQDPEGLVKTRVLDVSWRELERDAERAIEFDQTHLWRKVYDEEYDMPGGTPYGVLIGDYEVCHRPSKDHPHDDINILRAIGQTAASAFVPFITSAHPSLLGLSDFGQLERHIDMDRVFLQPEYAAWNALRREPDMQFIGLTVPKVLMRLPHTAGYTNTQAPCCPSCRRGLPREPRQPTPCPSCGKTITPEKGRPLPDHALGFRYEEAVASRGAKGYLWGNSAFAFAGVLIRAFTDCRWLADIRGFDRNEVAAGVVADLPSHGYGHDRHGVAMKMATDVAIDDSQEKAMSDQGLIPLVHAYDTDWHVFYSNNALHRPKVYDDESTTLNARISSMLQYTLCTARFAHYLKVQMRERIGSQSEAYEMQNRLINWINSYVTQDSQASAEIKAKYPLRDAQIEVVETPGKPGVYHCDMRLWPHYQLDEVSVSVRMITPVSDRRR